MHNAEFPHTFKSSLIVAGPAVSKTTSVGPLSSPSVVKVSRAISFPF